MIGDVIYFYLLYEIVVDFEFYRYFFLILIIYFFFYMWWD